jgi:hypothetical protein
MEAVNANDATQDERRFANEFGIVHDAIAMVAAGGSRRVTVAGLTFGRELLFEASALAHENQVALYPLVPLGGVGCDILVEAAPG